MTLNLWFSRQASLIMRINSTRKEGQGPKKSQINSRLELKTSN